MKTTLFCVWFALCPDPGTPIALLEGHDWGGYAVPESHAIISKPKPGRPCPLPPPGKDGELAPVTGWPFPCE